MLYPSFTQLQNLNQIQHYQGAEVLPLTLYVHYRNRKESLSTKNITQEQGNQTGTHHFSNKIEQSSDKITPDTIATQQRNRVL